MIANGYNGRMEIQGDTVVLTRKLMFGRSKGAKSINIKSITALQFKPSGALTAGYLQIAFSGSKESKSGYTDALKDENTIAFTGKDQQRQFEAIRDEIERRRGASAQPFQAASVSDELGKLAALHSSGALNDAEFAAAKARLLG